MIVLKRMIDTINWGIISLVIDQVYLNQILEDLRVAFKQATSELRLVQLQMITKVIHDWWV